MCIIPFGGISRDRSKIPMLEKESVGASVDNDFLNRGLPPSTPASTSAGERSNSKIDAKSKPKKMKSTAAESPDESDRITFSRLIAILREAYIITMKSFASKPGGLGGLAMGGNIDLPDATPSRTFKEPRNFVRSWSKRRPDYISSPAPDFSQRAQQTIAVQ